MCGQEPLSGPESIAMAVRANALLHLLRDDFTVIYDQIRPLTLKERLSHPGIPQERARYFVAAIHLVHYILRMLDASSFYVSRHTLKEGLIAEWIENLD